MIPSSKVPANSQKNSKVGRKRGKPVPVIQITPADVVEKSLEKSDETIPIPKSFKSRVNEYDTENSNDHKGNI